MEWLRRRPVKNYACFMIVTSIVIFTGCLYSMTVKKEKKSIMSLPKHGSKQLRRGECTFDDDFSKNFKKLESLSFKKSENWYSKLGFTAEPPVVHNDTLPVVVTGANSQYYKKSQAFIISLHEVLLPKYPALKIIFYDLGLTGHQRSMVKKYCKCEVRSFPFSKLPKHVRNLNNYAFKPMIVKWVYQEFGYVWWFDSAFVLASPDLDSAFRHQQKNNTWFHDYGVLTNNSSHSKHYEVISHTRPDTFAYFQEDPCYYISYSEIQGSPNAFKTSHVASVVLRQWVSCALDPGCIDPPGAYLYCTRPIPATFKEADIGSCHRYDQSILNIIFRRLYQNNVPSHGIPTWVILDRETKDRKQFPITWWEWFHLF